MREIWEEVGLQFPPESAVHYHTETTPLRDRNLLFAKLPAITLAEFEQITPGPEALAVCILTGGESLAFSIHAKVLEMLHTKES